MPVSTPPLPGPPSLLQSLKIARVTKGLSACWGGKERHTYGPLASHAPLPGIPSFVAKTVINGVVILNHLQDQLTAQEA